MKLLCKKCKRGSLEWVGAAVEDFDESMARDLECKHCGNVFHGMQEFIDYTPNDPVQPPCG